MELQPVFEKVQGQAQKAYDEVKSWPKKARDWPELHRQRVISRRLERAYAPDTNVDFTADEILSRRIKWAEQEQVVAQYTGSTALQNQVAPPEAE